MAQSSQQLQSSAEAFRLGLGRDSLGGEKQGEDGGQEGPSLKGSFLMEYFLHLVISLPHPNTATFLML